MSSSDGNKEEGKDEEAIIITPPKTPNELTKEFLTLVLEKEYGEKIQVDSFHVRDMDAGVLSHVVIIDVEFDVVAASSSSNNKTNQLPNKKKFVAKFLQPQFPLEHMFVVESYFYRQVEKNFSFQTPRPVYTSNSMIMVEHVASDISYTAVEGCPKDLVLPIITRLGKFHGRYIILSEQLDQICNGLAVPAGVGSTLSGLAKETQFSGLWTDFLNNIPSLDDSVRQQMKDICQRISSRRLRDIHDAIHENPNQTLIHGDFHVANMLLQQQVQKQKNNEKDKIKTNIWLVDWATCGKGNPLIDLAFFAIVSMTSSVRQELEQDMLDAYQKALNCPKFTLEYVKKFYRLCLLNQFLILVCYDQLSRQLSSQAKRPEELTNHFNVVNARACYALIDNFDEDLLPRHKTKEEAAMPPQGDATL